MPTTTSPDRVETTTKTHHTSNGQTVVVTVTREYYDPCSYTFSHTQSWCGHPGCRES